MNTRNNILIAVCLVGGFFIAYSRKDHSKEYVIKNEYVKVTDSSHGKAHTFTITPLRSVNHFCEINFSSSYGKLLGKAIIDACTELSSTHNDADFQLEISQAASQMLISVNLYPQESAPLSFGCPFCEPLKLKGNVLAENELVRAFEKSSPAREPINFLIAPKKHIVNYKDKNDVIETFTAQLAMAQTLAARLENKDDITLSVNNGTGTGQAVFHSHMHFLTSASWKK